MFDDNPVLKERLMAAGAFLGIGLFGAGAVDVMVTGGFDFASDRAPYDRGQPSAYVRVVDAANYAGESFRAISWDDGFVRAPDTSRSEERLAGGHDGSAPPPDMMAEAEDGDLYQEIAALYDASEDAYVEEPSYQDAQAMGDYVEPDYEGDPYADEEDKIASAYENASPW